jgi:ATP adenylyltransferase
MKVLFTPWRYSYLTAPKTARGCIFCDASAAGPEPSLLTLMQTPRSLVMLNRYPYSNGHLMIAPIVHQGRLFESDGATLDELIRLTAAAQQILSEVYSPHGFNIGMNFGEAAGAGIADHYHIHLVPRWGGDSNFMTVTAETRLVPEDLGTTWSKLRPKFEAIERRFTAQ